MNPIDQLKANECITLDSIDGWDRSVHVFEKLDVLAIKAAFASKRPLLVRGEPGTGKTQLARAVAQQLGWALIYKVINGLTELEDLFWHYDAVDRLSEAQALADENRDVRKDNLKHRRFLTPGPLWWAFDWEGAQSQYDQWSRRNQGRPTWVRESTPPGIVLLIDEIDKADLDLPNGLLESFGQNSFQIPWLESGTVKRGDIPLLAIITTNEERELPRAFLRRCLVLQLEYPRADEQESFNLWLQQRGQIHFPADKCDDSVLLSAAEMIRSDRLGTEYGAIRPGLAEYIDLLKVVTELHPMDREAQQAEMEELSQFVRKKQGKVF
ncbi:MAG: MoxR family ATPase [Pseudomonadota bacterium]